MPAASISPLGTKKVQKRKEHCIDWQLTEKVGRDWVFYEINVSSGHRV